VQDSIVALVACVLHLGNVQFKESGSKMEVVDKKPVANAAKCLQISEDVLLKALTFRTLKIRGQEPMDVPLKLNEASDTRHALGKFIYGNLFNWLVIKVNKAMNPPGGAVGRSVGCLDIFGFEIFKHNSFEQLCINFTNEMLQQHFNNQTFKLEEAIYRQEKISFKSVAFIDNVPMIELITKKPKGVLPLLDEELVVPKGSDKTYCEKLIKEQGSNKVFKRVMKNPDHFIIKHYAGEVEYDTHGFLEKNRDTLTEDLLEAVKKSTNKLMNELFPPNQETDGKKSKKASLSKQFQQQLNNLMTTLNKTEPHYVRCVKPNQIKANRVSDPAGSFDPMPCYEQLMFSGVFEAVSIRKQGFPFRLKHDVFAKRYGVLHPSGSVSGDRSGCQQIVEACKLNKENVQTGTTLMLYRAEEHKSMELNRSIKVMTKEINEKLEKICSESPGSNKEEYFDRLAMAVRQADEFRLKTPTSDKARKLLDDYIEARMDPNTKRLLEEAVRTMEKPKLEKALSEAALHGYRTSLTRKCSELLEQVSDAEAALTASIEQVSLEMLEKSLEMCAEFGYTGGKHGEAKQLCDDIKRYTSELESAKASKDHVVLQSALDGAGQ
jgi:myosin heavy subunit